MPTQVNHLANLPAGALTFSHPPFACSRKPPNPTYQDDKSTDAPTQILLASLAHVPDHGWTTKSLTMGAASLSYPSIAHGLFPRGGMDLVNFFLASSRRR